MWSFLWIFINFVSSAPRYDLCNIGTLRSSYYKIKSQPTIYRWFKTPNQAALKDFVPDLAEYFPNTTELEFGKAGVNSFKVSVPYLDYEPNATKKLSWFEYVRNQNYANWMRQCFMRTSLKTIENDYNGQKGDCTIREGDSGFPMERKPSRELIINMVHYPTTFGPMGKTNPNITYGQRVKIGAHQGLPTKISGLWAYVVDLDGLHPISNASKPTGSAPYYMNKTGSIPDDEMYVLNFDRTFESNGYHWFYVLVYMNDLDGLDSNWIVDWITDYQGPNETARAPIPPPLWGSYDDSFYGYIGNNVKGIFDTSKSRNPTANSFVYLATGPDTLDEDVPVATRETNQILEKQLDDVAKVNCTPIECPLRELENGVVSPANRAYLDFNESATFTCNENHKLVGSTAGSGRCGFSGKVQAYPPAGVKCEPIFPVPLNIFILSSKVVCADWGNMGYAYLFLVIFGIVSIILLLLFIGRKVAAKEVTQLQQAKKSGKKTESGFGEKLLRLLQKNLDEDKLDKAISTITEKQINQLKEFGFALLEFLTFMAAADNCLRLNSPSLLSSLFNFFQLFNLDPYTFADGWCMLGDEDIEDIIDNRYTALLATTMWPVVVLILTFAAVVIKKLTKSKEKSKVTPTGGKGVKRRGEDKKQLLKGYAKLAWRLILPSMLAKANTALRCDSFKESYDIVTRYAFVMGSYIPCDSPIYNSIEAASIVMTTVFALYILGTWIALANDYKNRTGDFVRVPQRGKGGNGEGSKPTNDERKASSSKGSDKKKKGKGKATKDEKEKAKSTSSSSSSSNSSSAKKGDQVIIIKSSSETPGNPGNSHKLAPLQGAPTPENLAPLSNPPPPPPPPPTPAPKQAEAEVQAQAQLEASKAQAKDQAKNAKAQVKAQASDQAENAKTRAKDKVEESKTQARHKVEETKEQAKDDAVQKANDKKEELTNKYLSFKPNKKWFEHVATVKMFLIFVVAILMFGTQVATPLTHDPQQFHTEQQLGQLIFIFLVVLGEFGLHRWHWPYNELITNKIKQLLLTLEGLILLYAMLLHADVNVLQASALWSVATFIALTAVVAVHVNQFLVQPIRYQRRRKGAVQKKAQKVPNLAGLDRSMLAELKGFKQSFPGVFETLRAACILIGCDPKEVSSWDLIKLQFTKTGKDAFRTRLALFDFDATPEATFATARKVFSVDTFDRDSVANKSQAAALIHDWVETILEMQASGGDGKAVLKRIETKGVERKKTASKERKKSVSKKK